MSARGFAGRVAAFYFVLFVGLGAQMPYLPVYYRWLGFTGREIAALGSVSPVALMLVPPVWGFVADRTGGPARLVRFATAGAAICLAPLLWARSWGSTLATLMVWALFASPVGSLVDTLAVAAARSAGTSFARLRLFGSLGFVAGSFGFGWHLGHGGAPHHVPPTAIGLAVIVATSAALLVRAPASDRPGGAIWGDAGGAGSARDAAAHEGAANAPPSVRDGVALLGEARLVVFLLSAMLHWASFSPFNLFFAVHLSTLPGGAVWVGPSFAVAVLAEATVMAAPPGWLDRRGFVGPLLVVFGMTAARWAAMSTLDGGASMTALQAVHGLSFGAFYVIAVGHVDAMVPARLRATGRALFAASVFGLGGIGGNALAGVVHDVWGPRGAFVGAAALDVLAALALLPAARLHARFARRGGQPA